MDVGLTRRGDYVVRVALELARCATGVPWRKAGSLAEATGVPAAYVAQILGLLVRRGLVEAHAGPKGGYRLRGDASAVSLLDVIETAEGSLVSVRCVLRGTRCSPRHPCLVHPALARAQDALRRELADTTLASLLAAQGTAGFVAG